MHRAFSKRNILLENLTITLLDAFKEKYGKHMMQEMLEARNLTYIILPDFIINLVGKQ